MGTAIVSVQNAIKGTLQHSAFIQSLPLSRFFQVWGFSHKRKYSTHRTELMLPVSLCHQLKLIRISKDDLRFDLRGRLRPKIETKIDVFVPQDAHIIQFFGVISS